LVPVLPIRQEQYAVRIKREEALRYGVNYEAIYNRLRTLFNENQINTLQSGQETIPVVLGEQQRQNVFQQLEEGRVNNREGEPVPLRYFIRMDREEAYKSLEATRNGLAYTIRLNQYLPGIEVEIRNWVKKQNRLSVQFSGAVYDNERQIRELLVVLSIALLLLYLILAAQFESLLQPLLVMLMVPVGIAGAIAVLQLAGESINLIAIIGMTVMSGIVVNDAILKIDMMNRLRAEGHDLSVLIHGAGHRRLRPILMTSLTTILALAPVLITTGLGAELQRPLAWAVIGGLSVGTVASLYLLPVLYSFWLNAVNRNR
jgi:multidrug efflux pump subunit AcrB